MADATSDLMLEILKAVQKDLAEVKLSNAEIKAEVQAVRTHLLGLQQDVHNIYAILARHDARLERIERRLDIVEPVR